MYLKPSDYLTFWDIILVPPLLLVIFIFANGIKKKYIAKNQIYKYFVSGLFIKIFGGIALNLIYMFYYYGGDTIEYFNTASSISKLLFQNPIIGLSILFGNNSIENYSFFSELTGLPSYFNDVQSFNVGRFAFPFVLLSGYKMYIATILLDLFAFVGFWKFYKMVCEIYPALYKQFAYAVFFIPSVFFWGSGILKDSFTISASLWLMVNIYKIFIKKENIILNLIVAAINIYIILSIKPYIIIALLPAGLLWVLYEPIKSIKNIVLRTFISPLLIVVGVTIGLFSLSFLGSRLDKYSSKKGIIEKAKITQEDLKRAEQYGSNFYDLGTLDFSLKGLLFTAPAAIIAGLFRPFIWEARNPVMLITGVENSILLFFFIYIFYKVGIIATFRNIFKEPLAFVAFLFSLIFSFSVGLSTANFGALVRYRIPALPFFVCFLLIIWHVRKQEKIK